MIHGYWRGISPQLVYQINSVNSESSINLQQSTKIKNKKKQNFCHSGISCDLENSQVSIAILSRSQWGSDIFFSLLYQYHLFFTHFFVLYWIHIPLIRKASNTKLFLLHPFYTPFPNGQLLSHQAICILFGTG